MGTHMLAAEDKDTGALLPGRHFFLYAFGESQSQRQWQSMIPT